MNIHGFSPTLFDSVSRFIGQEVPVYAPTHLTDEERAKLLKEGRESDDRKFIDKNAVSKIELTPEDLSSEESRIARLAKCINKEEVFNELLKYMTYNSQYITGAKTAEEKYRAAIKYIRCEDAIDDLRDHNAGGGEYLSNQYQRCEGLKHLLEVTQNIK